VFVVCVFMFLCGFVYVCECGMFFLVCVVVCLVLFVCFFYTIYLQHAPLHSNITYFFFPYIKFNNF